MFLKSKKRALILVYILVFGLTNACAKPPEPEDETTARETAIDTIEKAEEPINISTAVITAPRPNDPIFDPSKKYIALSFDDGPNLQWTKMTMDVLDKYGAKASFFVNGGNISSVEHESLLRELIAGGHDVDNHSWNHMAFATGTPESDINRIHQTKESAMDDIKRTSQRIYEVTGWWPFAFRATYFGWGGDNGVLMGLDRELNMPFFDASVDTDDWRGHTPEAITAYLLHGMGPHCDCTGGGWICNIRSTAFDGALSESGNGADGVIMLMHDNPANTVIGQNTVNAVDMFIPELMELGYEFVTIRQLMMFKNASPQLFMGSGATANRWVPAHTTGADFQPLWPNHTDDWYVQDWWAGDVPPWERVRLAGAAISGALTADGTPTETEINIQSLTLSSNTGQKVEYAVNTVAEIPSRGWQKETAFSGLTAGTVYYFFARSASNETHNTGAVQMSEAIATANLPVTFINILANDAVNVSPLTLTFDRVVPDFAADDITVAGAGKGILNGPVGGADYSIDFIFPLEPQYVIQLNSGEPGVVVETPEGPRQTYVYTTEHRWNFATPWWIPGVHFGSMETDSNYTPGLSLTALNEAQYLVIEFDPPVSGKVSITMEHGDADWRYGMPADFNVNAQERLAIPLDKLDGIDRARSLGYAVGITRPEGSIISKVYFSNEVTYSETVTYTLEVSDIKEDVEIILEKAGVTFMPAHHALP